jgi:flavodoxin
MKKVFLIALALLFAQSFAQDDKVLIAYFTWSGNSKNIATQISKQINGEAFEIVSEKSYPDDIRKCREQAKTELKKQERPKLKTSVEDFSKYKTVILVYPNWWGTIPMPMASFIESYDFAGKTLIPICTHMGSKFGNSIGDIKKLAPKAKIGEGFHIRGLEDENSLNKKISDLLKNNKTVVWRL